jgi:hypothetical protein
MRPTLSIACVTRPPSHSLRRHAPHQTKKQEGCRQSAKVLGVDYDRYAAVVANNYRITAYTAERLEKRVRGLMELFKCERGVVGTAVTGNPGCGLGWVGRRGGGGACGRGGQVVAVHCKAPT